VQPIPADGPRGPEPTAAWTDGSDDAAFAAFYAAHEGLVYRTALALTRYPMTAEEVVADTFLRAYAAREAFDASRPPGPWLQRIAINLAFNQLRRRRLHREPLEAIQAAWVDPDPRASPELACEQREDEAALRAAIGRLPERQRAVVVLRYLQEQSLAEVAAAIDEPVGRVKSRLHDALTRLRRELREESRQRERARERLGAPARLEGRPLP
jgi:RNA polymerase sigma-70 factor (ECF subfamily)